MIRNTQSVCIGHAVSENEDCSTITYGEDLTIKEMARMFQQLEMTRLLIASTNGKDINDKYRLRGYQRRLQKAKILIRTTDAEDINEEYRSRGH